MRWWGFTSRPGVEVPVVARSRAQADPPKRRAGPAGRRDVIDERIFVDYSCEWGYKDAGRLWISHEAARCSSAACHDRPEEVLR